MITKTTKTIGLIIPDIANPFFPEIARGVEDKANAEGYTVILCNSDNKLVKEDAYIDMLQEKMVDGIIFTASSSRTTVSSSLLRVKVPVITVDRDIPDLRKQGKITVDNEQGAYDAVLHMIESGYKKIYHLSGPLTSKTAQERYNGYLRAMKEKNIALPTEHLFEGQFDSDWGHDAMLRLIMKDLEFDGIFCGNDLIALGVLKGLQENKYMVPRDVGVVGFDDIHMAKMVTPELTTVRHPKYEMGFHAAELLIKMIQGIHTDQHEYVLKTVYVKRGSTR
jgi:LacI family transcriptional regulator